MPVLFRVLLLIIMFPLGLLAQNRQGTVGTTEPEDPWIMRGGYAIGYELNNGVAHIVSIGLDKELQYLSIRYMNGREFVTSNNGFRTLRRYPYRTIESIAALYGFKSDDYLRIGFGLSLSNGNRRGEMLSQNNNTQWHEDFLYRVVGLPFEVIVSPYAEDAFSIDIMLSGELNPKRAYFVLGLGFQYYFRR